MASLEDIVTATKIISEDPDSIMGGSGSKPTENRVGDSDVREDDGGTTAAAVVSEGVLQNETVVGSAFDGGGVVDCGLGDQEKEKSSVSYVTTSVSVNGSDSGDAVVGSNGKNKDCEGSCVDNGEDKCADYEQLNGSGGDGLDLDEDGDPEGEGDVEKLGNQDNGFRPGDFVWGKIKSHPWWPGQVYDPKDASEFAMKCKQEGRLLVAFFGDGSCSWCSPSQLIPFVENFVEMSARSSSKSFLNAVQGAVDEVGRLVELEMTCKCIPEEKKDALARPTVVNAGLKAGVLRPEVDVRRLSIPIYESAQLIEKVREIAKTALVCSALDVAVIRSWLSAFYCSKGGLQLPVYHDPLPIEGLEDKNKNVNEVSDDFSIPIEVPIMGPQDDDWLSSPTGGTVNSQGRSDNKIYHKRKQKSVAELMGEKKTIKPESRKRVTVKEGTDSEKPVSSQKRKKNNDGEVEEDGGASSTGKSVRKRRAKVSVSAEITDEKVRLATGVSEGPLSGKPKEIVVADVENTDSKEESERVLSPRERKKSKYLSPPYTNLTWRTGNSSFKAESEYEDDKSMKTAQVGESATEATANKSCEQKLPNGQAEGVDVSVDKNPETTENDKKMTFPASDVEAPVNELLSEIQLAALDPFYLSKKGSLDMVWAFVSALRSSTYLHGPDYKFFRKCTTVGKRKSLPSQLGNQENDSKKKKAKSPEQSTPKALKAEGTSDTSKPKKTAEVSALPCLILEFTPGFPLPSKEDIIKLFSKFGSLNRKETKVVTDTHSIQIVYVKDSDAEAAFKSSLSRSPFGLENVNYRLQRSSAGSRSTRSHTKVSPPLKRAIEKRNSLHPPTDDLISDVSIIRQKLEIMTAIMENYHSKFSAKDKSSLKDEMKHLMEEVETISEKVRVMAENTSS
ncbi:hypothetical protein Salat_1383100 [Sesamum alatum]|uniref:PWWP domain-containing protein n=1 Tax=Sesamum alatum TaxID=300844 RepID=A0AAE1Y9D6_9LAMI|nr:hypothetical protein Salat_1383100 [Sesamum alatum]